MPDSALLIIDMQNDLCHDARRENKVSAMIPSLQTAIELFVNAQQLVLYTCFSLSENDEQFERFGDRYCIAGTRGAEIISELQPLHGPVIRKKKHSAFFETELHRILRASGVKKVYLAGLQTHICILTTAADAHFRGYRTIAIEECVLSSQDEKHRYALDWIAKYVGEVKSIEETAVSLNQRSLPLHGHAQQLEGHPAAPVKPQKSVKAHDISRPRITMADGAGGAATLRLIKEEILTRFGNPALNVLEDSSWVGFGNGQLIVTADSHIVDPPVFPGGDIGSLAVAGTVNDLIASGARPMFLTLSLIIGEGFPLDTLQRILDSIARTAASAEVQIVAGDTKVVEGKPASLFIHTSGFGSPLDLARDYSVARAQTGDRIVVTGTMGDHGFAVLSYREGLGFEHRVESDCAPLNDLLLPILGEFDQIRSLRDPTRGGLVGALVDIAESSRVDLLVRRDRIPIKSEVAYGCEMLGIDPLELVNEGKMVLVVGDSQSTALLSRLQSHPLASESSIIGKVQSRGGRTGQVLFDERCTVKVVRRPEGMPIPRLC